MSLQKNRNYYAIVMAGGIGSRFWPSSKASRPKQFIDILGVGETLFQTTFKRLSKLIPEEHIFVLTNENYVSQIKEQIPGILEEQIVPEPDMRNTAPCILLGALKIRDKNPDAQIIVAPSDHWIPDEKKFLKEVEFAFQNSAKHDYLITLGIKPDGPNTGYGYIQFDEADDTRLKRVTRFTEKPNLKTAKKLIKEGNYLWNAGIFIWSAKYIIENFQKFLPEMFALFEDADKIWNTSEEIQFLKQQYGKAENISIDYGIMEKSDSVYVIPVDFKWSDLGTWTSLQKELESDEDHNTVVNAELISEDSENNIIATAKNKLVVVKGLSDFIIVEDNDVLMIVPKSDEQEIKRIRQQVIDNYGKELG